MRERARFVRETADVRRQALIDATAACLAEKGAGGTSVRSICARAGVSSGLLTHYFEGVDALILATYRDVGGKVAAALDAAVDAAGDDPRDRLRACLQANFIMPVLDPQPACDLDRLLESGQVRPPRMASAHAEVYRSSRVQLEELLRAAAPHLPLAGVRIAAISLIALVDGLWLELCLDRSAFSPEEAQAMVSDAMDTLIAR